MASGSLSEHLESRPGLKAPPPACPHCPSLLLWSSHTDLLSEGSVVAPAQDICSAFPSPGRPCPTQPPPGSIPAPFKGLHTPFLMALHRAPPTLTHLPLFFFVHMLGISHLLPSPEHYCHWRPCAWHPAFSLILSGWMFAVGNSSSLKCMVGWSGMRSTCLL